MNTSELRQACLQYFHDKGHEIVASSSLVPDNDPTLLFTNAGMNQFKDVFLGQDQRSYSRATSSQRCVRAGGKHNDLENVGYTARHHTFFEMLGNFSFGDYFKREAIQFAWEFLTQVLGLPEEKLWVTVFHEDKEAEEIWLNEMGVSAERFSRLGEKDNFWQMGDTGPCGPCTEIFYDHGPGVAGGPPGSPDDDGDRYIEIWNLVFMQFNRDTSGILTPLPKPSVDTGMGLERIAAVLQGVHSNYEIDLFQTLIGAVARLANTSDLSNSTLRVIADHIRSCGFLIADGVLPSNEGRGYVLRRIIRRAVRHGHKLGINGTFFHKLVAVLAQVMGDAYPELITQQAQVEKILLLEEEQFAKTLDQGLRILEQDIAELQGNVIPGETIFRLYDTYGFPFDLTADIARERNLTMDVEGFDQAMNAQRERARSASQFAVDLSNSFKLEGETCFHGYNSLNRDGSVLAIVQGSDMVGAAEAGAKVALVLDHTPFYAESGGQVGDVGIMVADGVRFEVRDVTKQGDHFLHHGMIKSGSVKLGDRLTGAVDQQTRQQTARNHSATHLLHAALRRVLGTHVTQKGSLVAPDKLRFDFSHFEAVSAEQLKQIEELVNQQIQDNTPVNTEVMALDQAKNRGVMALFGEKYADEVRVLTMGTDRFSAELCGGTHVTRTGDIGLMKIISEAGIAAGVRRIEAITGQAALDWYTDSEQRLMKIAAMIKANRDSVVERVEQLLTRSRDMEKELDQLKSKLASSAGADLASQAIEVKGVKVLAHAFEGLDSKSLRTTLDQLKDKLGTAIIVLGNVEGDKVSLAAGVTQDTMSRVKAGELVNFVAQQVGGKGGGRPDMAQAGGNNPAGLQAALASVPNWVDAKL